MIEHLFRIVAHGYYCGEHEAARRSIDRLATMRMHPDMECVYRRNRTWYTERLDQLLPATFERIDCERPAGWSLFNPSIVDSDEGVLINVRSSNYQIVDGQYVMPPEDNGVIRTTNIVGHRGVIGHRWDARYQQTQFPVDGLEDVRLNWIDDELHFSATVRNMAPHDGTARIATGKFDRSVEPVGLVCPETADGAHEKNWMPIVGRQEWLYACSVNGRTATVRLEDGAWHVTHHAEAPHVAAQFRGGSQLVPLGTGSLWLAIVHEVAEDTTRVYEHRFVVFDEHKGWRIESISQPFAFRETRAIEFCAGLCVSGDVATATFGVRDAEAWVVDMPLQAVLALATERKAWG